MFDKLPTCAGYCRSGHMPCPRPRECTAGKPPEKRIEDHSGPISDFVHSARDALVAPVGTHDEPDHREPSSGDGSRRWVAGALTLLPWLIAFGAVLLHVRPWEWTK